MGPNGSRAHAATTDIATTDRVALVTPQDDDIDQPHSGQGQKNARAASGSNITKPENMAVSEDGVPLAAAAAAAGGSAGGGKGR